MYKRDFRYIDIVHKNPIIDFFGMYNDYADQSFFKCNKKISTKYVEHKIPEIVYTETFVIPYLREEPVN
jgi:hypothetical protein